MHSIDSLKKIKMQFMDWKKIFMMHITGKGLHARKNK